jgi:peptidyl-prolyl cis-trans isomerase SurA
MKRLIYACAALFALAAPPLGAEILEQVLVKVNGEIITKTDLEQRQVAYLRRNREVTPQDLETDEGLKKALAEVTPQVIGDAVDELLVLQRGRELNYRLGDDQFASILENIKKENKLESEEQFQAALKQEGLTLADLRKSIERQMLMSRVQQVEVYGKIAVSEEEARAYYAAHPEQFTTPSVVTLREILVSVPETSEAGEKGVNVGLDEAAKEKAEAARARVAGGADFAAVAAEVSDAPSKANGGLIGPVNRSEMAPDLQKMLETLKVGEVGPVVRTPQGYLILKLETSTPVITRSFEDARGDIGDRVAEQKQRVEFEKYLAKLRGQAIIEWKNEELKKAYEQRLAARAAAPGGA